MVTFHANSRFYEPCLRVLLQNAPSPMKVSEIINAVRQANPELDYRKCSGGIRAMLISISSRSGSPVLMVQGQVT